MKKLTYAILLLAQATVLCVQAAITPDQIGIIREWKIASLAEFEPARTLSTWPGDYSNAGHRYTRATVADVVITDASGMRLADYLIMMASCDRPECTANNCTQTMLIKREHKSIHVLRAWQPDDGHERGLCWCVTQAKDQCSSIRFVHDRTVHANEIVRVAFFIPDRFDAVPLAGLTLLAFNDAHKEMCELIRDSIRGNGETPNV